MVTTEPVAIRPLREVEREYVLDALLRARGNKKACAAGLRISVKTLYNMLRRWGVSDDFAQRRRPESVAMMATESAMMATSQAP